MATLKELSDAATPGAWYTVDPPWGDGTWIVAGNPDPHAGTMVCDCEDLHETRPGDGPDAADDAAFIAALVTAYRSGRLRETANDGGNSEIVGQPMLVWNSKTKDWHVLGEDGARFELFRKD